ncbi:protein broad-minded- hypothetical protein [Limosa lapponica baueri]|uniref:Uncharacterized protein n=1 Tax=Limosa lapponica baueri TaxID=1758121 RepID=A0A2I0U9H4_LIMLA|nr:protein broad-minded- hypothetical protein [Limosa lapponica baueri]
MVFTRKKTMASVSSTLGSDAASQTKLSWEHTATQTSGCRVCPALMLVWDGSGEHACGRCAQAEEFLCSVMELREEVGSDEVVRSPRAMKRDFRTLGRLVKGSGEQVVFSSISPVAGNDEGHNQENIRKWVFLSTVKVKLAKVCMSRPEHSQCNELAIFELSNIYLKESCQWKQKESCQRKQIIKSTFHSIRFIQGLPEAGTQDEKFEKEVLTMVFLDPPSYFFFSFFLLPLLYEEDIIQRMYAPSFH